MSDIAAQLEESVEGTLVAFSGRPAQAELAAGRIPERLWREISALGLSHALLPELAGGAGCAPPAVLPAFLAIGRHAGPVPVGEDMFARWLLHRAGLPAPEGLVTLAPDARALAVDGQGRISGTLGAVPWGRHAVAVVVGLDAAGESDARIALLATDGAECILGANLAGEPRDRFVFRDTRAVPVARAHGPGPRVAGAALRAAMIAGAVRGTLDIAVAHARVRQQFGKPVAAFQAIQHQLAVLAEETLAADMAARSAFAALDGEAARPWAAIAKIRCGDAAGTAVCVGHQVLGAMGFTREHDLHLLTTRLMSWRTEFGGARAWSAILADAAAEDGALWERLVQWGDATGRS
jgi:alkylation response protein AidB-like acyl-CoA dehydrogenase